jgi:phage-related minor tail protein
MENPYVKREDATSAIKAQYDLAAKFIETQQVLENALANLRLENEQKVLDAKKDSYQKQLEQIDLNSRKENEALKERIQAIGLQNHANSNQRTLTGNTEYRIEKEILTDTATVFKNISNILNVLEIGADSFVGKMITGFQLVLGIIQNITSTAEAVKTVGGFLSFLGLFDSGGFTGEGGRLEPAGIVHRGEFVINKEATSQYFPLLELINSGSRTRGFSFSSGGFADSSFSTRPVINVKVYSEVEKTKAVRFLTNYTPLYNTRSQGSNI